MYINTLYTLRLWWGKKRKFRGRDVGEKTGENVPCVAQSVFVHEEKKQKKQQGTGCSSQFYLDYSLAFLYPNKFRGPYHFKDLMRKTIDPKVRRISAWRWNPWSIGNPRWWRKFENGVQQLFCVWRLGLFWRKNLFQTYQASLCHMENAGTICSNKHIQVACGIITVYPIYIVDRCGSEIIWPNTFHKSLISKCFL